MNLQIWDSGNNIYNLLDSFMIIDDPLERREGAEDIAFSHGAQDLSDGKYRQRIVVLSGNIAGVNDTTFRYFMDRMRQYFSLDDFRLVDPGGNRFINVKKCTNFNTVFGVGGFNRYTDEIEVELLCIDPFWYSLTESIHLKAALAGTTGVPDTFSITNNGNFMTRPIVTILSNAAANNDIIIKNTTDNNNAFRYADPAFDATDSVSISPVNGTVTATKAAILSTTIKYFTGRFPRLLPGINNYEFIGLNSDVTFIYREAWL